MHESTTMGQVNVSLPSDGSTADVSDYNTPITTIVDEINGNLDNSNISASAAIAGSKLASSGIDNTQLALGVPVQMVSVSSSAMATGTTTVPLDDTIPQNTEGTEFLTLAITPKSATNALVIEVTGLFTIGTADRFVIGGLFQDSTADALAATIGYNDPASTTRSLVVPLRHSMVAGTTSATTFKLRAGPNAAATVTFNGRGGARTLGATTKSVMTITEYKAA